MREHERDRSLNAIDDLYAARRVDSQEFSDLWNRLPSAPILKHTTQVPNEPVQGMFVVDPVRAEFCFYLGTEWICIGRREPTFAIKVYSDTKGNIVRNGAFRWVVPSKYDGWYIVNVESFNGTPGSGATTVQISRVQGTLDILSTRSIIPSGQLWSGTGAVVNQTRNQVFAGQDLWVDVDTIGAGSKGLGCFVDLLEDQIT